MLTTKALNYNHFFDLSSELLLSVDLEGNILSVNHAFAENLGYSTDFFINKNISDFLFPDDLVSANDEINKMLTDGLVSPSFTNHYLHKNGTYRKLKWFAKLVPSERLIYATAKDITDSKDSTDQNLNFPNRTKELELALKSYQALFDNTSDLFCSVDIPSGKLINVNKAIIEKSGYSRAELIGKSAIEIYHPNCWPIFKENLKTFKTTGFINNLALTLLTKDGKSIDVELNARTILDHKGNVESSISILRDISEKRILENALRQSQLLFKTLTDKSPVGITLTSPDRKLLYVNSTFAKMIGFSVEELMGKDWKEITYQEDQSEILLKYESLLENREGSILFEKRYYHKSGKIIWCRLTLVKIWDDTTKEDLIITTINNITKPKKLDLALKEREKQFRTLASLSPMGIYQNDASGACTYVNDTVSKIVGVPIDQCLGNGWAKCLYEADKEKVTEAWSNTVKNGTPYLQECRFLHPDGRLKWALVSAKAVTTPKGQQTGFVGTITDITEQKKVQTELEQFIYSISHDLRAPVRHIEGFTTWIIDEESKNMSASGKELLDRVTISARRLGLMIDDLLEYSRNRNIVLQKSNKNLNEIVEKVLEIHKDATVTRNIQWKIAKLPSVFVDKKMMISVFENLISNAVKYTFEQQNPIIEIWSEESSSFSTIFIKDNGVGFNMNYHEKLFVIFQRLHQHNKSFPGNGIGLANVKRIIESHRGSIDGEGIVDKGALFHFTIPKNI